MRHYFFILFFSTLFISNNIFAATLDAATVKNIHNATKSSFTARCLQEMRNMNTAACNCLANKVDTTLNDADVSS